jgi:hypothetical protein
MMMMMIAGCDDGDEDGDDYICFSFSNTTHFVCPLREV